MTGKETIELEVVIAKTLRPLEDLLDKIVSPGGLLGDLHLDVGDIKREQKYQADDLEAIHHDMRGVHDTLDSMPKQWNKDIDLKIESTMRQRDDITGAVDEAVERERLRMQHEMTQPVQTKPDGFFKEMFRGSGKAVIMLMVVFAMAFGAVVFTKCGDTEHQEILEQVQEELKKANGDAKLP